MKSSRRKPPSPLAGCETLVTVGDWLRFVATTFARADLAFDQGLHGPQEEAVFLVGRFLALEPEDLPQFLGSRLTKNEIASLQILVRRRLVERVPVPYLVGEAWQGGLRFFVDERVLIPRSYIAGLIPAAIRRFAGPGWNPKRILEIGTGSGALAVLAARAFPESIVDAADISPDALQVAHENVRRHGLEGRVQLLQSDIFSGIPSLAYDLIMANPPYEPLDVVEAIPAELAHEPRLALLGGTDGMDCVRRIVRKSRDHLSPRGVVVLEIGGLRGLVESEFPGSYPHIFELADGSDAVVGFRKTNLPKA